MNIPPFDIERSKVDFFNEKITNAQQGIVFYKYAPLLSDTINKIRLDSSEIPLVLKIQKHLADIPNVNTRLNVAYEMEDKLLNGERDDVFRSLIHYIRILENIVSCNGNQEQYESHAKDHNVLSWDSKIYYGYIGFAQGDDCYKEFLKFSQWLYFYSHNKNDYKLSPEQLPVYVELFRDKIVAKPITEFCKSLLTAEKIRKQLLYKKDIEPVLVKDFPIALRKYCFEAYLNYQKAEELKILLENNDRLENPGELESKFEVLRKEAQVYRETIEAKCDPEILKMAKYFILYLRKELGYNDHSDEMIDPMSEEYNIPNLNSEIDKRIKAVYKANVCKHKADWGAVFKLWIEDGTYKRTEYKPAAERINNAIGKKNVTTASDIRQSPALRILKGVWRSEGWEDREHNKTSGGLLNRYVSIARIYTK